MAKCVNRLVLQYFWRSDTEYLLRLYIANIIITNQKSVEEVKPNKFEKDLKFIVCLYFATY